MSDRPCALPKCRRTAAVAHAVRPSYMSDIDARQPANAAKITRYEVCTQHDAEYFGAGGFLTSERCERIRRELRPLDSKRADRLGSALE